MTMEMLFKYDTLQVVGNYRTMLEKEMKYAEGCEVLVKSAFSEIDTVSLLHHSSL
jgi:hypothetical protein